MNISALWWSEWQTTTPSCTVQEFVKWCSEIIQSFGSLYIHEDVCECVFVNDDDVWIKCVNVSIFKAKNYVNLSTQVPTHISYSCSFSQLVSDLSGGFIQFSLGLFIHIISFTTLQFFLLIIQFCLISIYYVSIELF